MALFQWACLFALLVATTQLSVNLRDDEDAPEPTSATYDMMEFGGLFDIHHARKAMMKQHMKQHNKEKDGESKLIGGERKSAESWPEGAWHAPLDPGDKYGPRSQGTKWPIPPGWPEAAPSCDAADMKVINYWALKQAKSRLPKEGRNATFSTGTCYKNNVGTWYGLHVPNYAKCYQRFYDVSTPCAQCIGSVYQMAVFNWSEPCYNFCYGRPSRRDGAHWCWEDCQSCMWYIGKKLSSCYGEPYDMVCRYAKELGKEGWFEKNGINPTKR